MTVTLIIPVFNEAQTIGVVLEKLASLHFPHKTKKEIIVVNDGSTDESGTVISSFHRKHPDMKYVRLKTNHGKGYAIRQGIIHATGEYIVVQDADLEYNPQDLIAMVENVVSHPGVVVYGDRRQRELHGNRADMFLFFIHFLGNLGLTVLTWILFGQHLVDGATCYKMFPRKAISGMRFHAERFDFDTELTAKLMKRGLSFMSVPISFTPRGYKDGKKLNALVEGPKALMMLLRVRLSL